MKNYEHLGLDRQFRKAGGVASTENRPAKVTAYDFGVNNQMPTGGISYSQLNVDSRAFMAIVTMSKKKGSFDKIQDAVNYVNGKGGGKILIKAGTYVQTADLVLHSNIMLEGEGYDLTIIDFNNGAYTIEGEGTFPTPYKENIHLKDLQITNSTDSTDGAVNFRYMNNFTLTRIKFDNNVYDVYLDNAFRGVIKECYSINSTNFVYTTSSEQVTIRDCDITSLATLGINIGTGSKNYIVNNKISTSTGSGIYLLGSYNWVNGNHIWANTYSIDVDGSNNHIAGNFTTGEGFIHLDNSGLNNKISGNYVASDGAYGVHVDDADNSFIIGNSLSAVTDGILIDNTCDKTVVVGNDTRGDGITDNGSNTATAANVD